MQMIHAEGLTRTFRVRNETIEAVRDLSLTVAEGELVAFLGPNGAGKSTSLRMLTTLLPPSSGKATVAGHDIVGDPGKVRNHIGFIGQGNGAGTDKRVYDELITQGRCYGLSKTECKKRAGELLATLDLEDLRNRVAGTLSGGQRRRLDIALGLVHRPKLLFLDEPSTGLDPQSRAKLWEHILRLRKEFGTTVFLTTHYLEEADSMAERVLVIDHGRLIADDTSQGLKAKVAGDRLRLTLEDAVQTGRAAEIAGREPSAHELVAGDNTVTLRVNKGDAVLPRLLKALDAAAIRVASVDLKQPTLDDVFLALTGRSLRESQGEL